MKIKIGKCVTEVELQIHSSVKVTNFQTIVTNY